MTGSSMEAAIAGFPGDRMVFTAMRMEAIVGLGTAFFSRGEEEAAIGAGAEKDPAVVAQSRLDVHADLCVVILRAPESRKRLWLYKEFCFRRGKYPGRWCRSRRGYRTLRGSEGLRDFPGLRRISPERRRATRNLFGWECVEERGTIGLIATSPYIPCRGLACAGVVGGRSARLLYMVA